MDLNEYLRVVIDNEVNKLSMLKRVKGVVKSVSDNGTQTVVQINSPPDANVKRVTIKTPSNADISVNDVVWIYYWKNIADGFILPTKMYGIGKYINDNRNSYILADFSGDTGIFPASGVTNYSNMYVSLAGRKQAINVYSNNVSANYIDMNGYNNKVFAYYNVAYAWIHGQGNTLSTGNVGGSNADDNRIYGDINTVQGSNNFVIGELNEVSGGTYAFSYSGDCAYNNSSEDRKFMIGSYPRIEGTAGASIATAFGCDIRPPASGNGMELLTNGDLNVRGTVNSNVGADYAEYEEWQDGNPDNEDRRGRFVTETGNYIRLSNSDDEDEVLGIVSVNPAVCGGAHSMEWKNKYVKDVFGEIIYKEVEIENEKGEKEKTMAPELNPDFRADQDYRSRSIRSEFSPVAYVGKVIAVDDGTCQVNGYCKPADNGIATLSETKTRFRVRERIDDTHVLVRIL